MRSIRNGSNAPHCLFCQEGGGPYETECTESMPVGAGAPDSPHCKGAMIDGETDCHASDIGHWLAMTGTWCLRRVDSPPHPSRLVDAVTPSPQRGRLWCAAGRRGACVSGCVPPGGASPSPTAALSHCAHHLRVALDFLRRTGYTETGGSYRAKGRFGRRLRAVLRHVQFLDDASAICFHIRTRYAAQNHSPSCTFSVRRS